MKFNGNWKITFRLTSGSSWSYVGYSMAFHETLASTNQISPNSMEFHRTRRAALHMTHGSMDQIQLSSIEFHGIWDYCFNHYQVPQDFHLIFHGIHGTPQSPNQTSSSSKGFHRIRKAPFKTTQMFYGILWNSMELWCRQMKYHSVPWNSRELWDCHFIQYHITLDLHVIFHGIPWNSGVAK